jgi:hypothetical protein
VAWTNENDKGSIKTYEQKYYAFLVGSGEGDSFYTYWSFSFSVHKANKGHQTTNPNHLNSDISECFWLVFVFSLSLSLSPFISKGKEYQYLWTLV